MFFETEPTRTLTLIEFLLVMLIGLASVAEDERDSLEHVNYQSRDAVSGAGVSSDVPPFFQVGEPSIVRKLPATFDRNKPLGLFVVNPAAENLKSRNKKDKKQSPALS